MAVSLREGEALHSAREPLFNLIKYTLHIAHSQTSH